MHRLEVPEVLAGVHVHGNDRVAIQVGAGPIATPVIAGRAAEHRVENLALLVEREVPAPVIDALPVLPAFVEPALRMVRIARLRHGGEVPQLRSRAHVERFRIAGRRPLRHLAVVRTDDDDVLEDERHTAPGDAHVDGAAGSERLVEFTARGLERHETSADGHQDARRDRSVARPVGHAAARGCAAGTRSRRQRASASSATGGWSACGRRAGRGSTAASNLGCCTRRRRRRSRFAILRSISSVRQAPVRVRRRGQRPAHHVPHALRVRHHRAPEPRRSARPVCRCRHPAPPRQLTSTHT